MPAREAGPDHGGTESVDWRALLDCSPVATWAEDLSAVARRFDELRAAGVDDVAAYFGAHPEELSRLARLHRVVAASRQALVLFGARDAEALRERLYALVDTPSRAALASELAALWRGETLVETEWRVQERVLSRRLAVATTAARGIVGHAILAATDITERRRSERELRFARFAIDRSHIPLFWIASDATLFYVNDAACATLGYTRAELLQLTILDIDPHFDRARWERRWADPNRETLFESEHRRKDGRAFPVEVNSNHVVYEGVEYSCSFATDITERKRAEDSQREAARRKDEFLGMLSHELRNPLAPIKTGVEVIERAPPGSEAARRAQTTISRQVNHLSRLVDELLDVTRIARGKIELKKERVELGELVLRCVEDHRAQFHKAGVELVLEPPSGPVRVWGDRTRLAQVMSNLLQNAAKFCPPGRQTFVSLETDVSGSNTLLRVRDTGRGVPPELFPHLFEPFVQYRPSLDRTKGGLGLGLSIAKGLVELHGGTIYAESRGIDEGTTFTVALPLDTTAPMGAGTPEASPMHSRRVLVVEDNHDAAETFRDLLELEGHRVEVAYDGRAALEKARRFRPDVVVCDIGLPEMNGFDFARALRAESGASRPTLIALSGYARPEDIAAGKEAGFDAHLAKPPSLDVLSQLLESAPVRAATN